MASSSTPADHLISICFLLILSLSSLHAQARESKFFNKFTRNPTPTGETTTTTTPTFAGEVTPALPPAESYTYGNGFGLYGNKFQPTSTTTNNNYNNKEFSEVSFQEKREFNNRETYPNNNNFNTNTNTNYNNNNNNNENAIGYNGAGQNYGMSDTRLLENGKYFYDVKDEEERYRRSNNVVGNYEASRGAYGGGRNYGNNNYYNNNNYNSNGNGYEYNNNNSDEAFQNNHQEGQGNQEEYVP